MIFKRLILLFLFITLVLVLLFSVFFFIKRQKTNLSEIQKIDCYEILKKTVNGNSMAPLIRNGMELKYLENYYACREPKRGDIVSYRYVKDEIPLIKRILVLGDDELAWSGNFLLVNGDFLTNSTGVKYAFSDKEKKMIGLYIEDGRMIENGYLIFGDNSRRVIDSRIFGAVHKDDFLGKFDLN